MDRGVEGQAVRLLTSLERRALLPVVALAIVVIVALAGMYGLAYQISGDAIEYHTRLCAERWARAGMATEWTSQGCLVEVRRGQWILERHVQINPTITP